MHSGSRRVPYTECIKFPTQIILFILSICMKMILTSISQKMCCWVLFMKAQLYLCNKLESFTCCFSVIQYQCKLIIHFFCRSGNLIPSLRFRFHEITTEPWNWTQNEANICFWKRRDQFVSEFLAFKSIMNMTHSKPRAAFVGVGITIVLLNK